MHLHQCLSCIGVHAHVPSLYWCPFTGSFNVYLFAPPHQTETRLTEKEKFLCFSSLWPRLLILVDSCAEGDWPDTLGTTQGVGLLTLSAEGNLLSCHVSVTHEAVMSG